MNININLTIDDRIVNFFKKTFKTRRAKLILLLSVLAIPLSIYAAGLTKPHTFSKGQVASSSEINANFDALFNCPSDMVDIGSACIDKYEAAVYTNADGTGTPLGGVLTGTDNYGTVGCIDTGAGCKDKVFAISKAGVEPSTYINWFQASIACANVGKRLPTNQEWQIAATGTPDPHTVDPANDSEKCNIWSASIPSGATGTNGTADKIQTGSATACVSEYGVYDMTGNVWEWAADWFVAGTAYVNQAEGFQNTTWPAGYGSDSTWNVGGRAHNGVAWQSGLPAAARRGGDWDDGSAAGVFALRLADAPSLSGAAIGFRCARGK